MEFELEFEFVFEFKDVCDKDSCFFLVLGSISLDGDFVLNLDLDLLPSSTLVAVRLLTLVAVVLLSEIFGLATAVAEVGGSEVLDDSLGFGFEVS